MVVAEAGMRILVVVVQQEAHMGRFWLPGEVRMVPPVKVIGIAIWGIGWWLVLIYIIGMLSHYIPY